MHAYRDQYAKLFRDGQNVILVAISADPVDTLAAWARDDQFQFLLASDTGAVVGRLFGAFSAKYKLDNRALFVVGPDGKIVHRETPFREIDPTAYTELGAALDSIVSRGPGGSAPSP